MIALHLEDSVFHLGTGNLLSLAATLSAAVLSLEGPNLDVGFITINFPTIIPINPLNPRIDRFLSFQFDVPLGADFLNLATISTFPTDVVVDDLFVYGDWQHVAIVPEPGTVALVAIGLATGRLARRKRR